jgi:tetratricopeptide (TPR) repeat protein
MIRQWFATMNELLDELIIRYPQASGEEKNQLQEQWNMLKSLSDDIIESWLQFEDRMAFYRELQQQQNAKQPEHDPQALMSPFIKGQGYFKLHMFAHASRHLEEAIASYPDFMGARMFLAMSRMHLKEWGEAQRHFQLIAAMSEESKLRAIAYNALGCIQAVYAHLDQAQSYFRKAIDTDPSFADPRRNLECCQQGFGPGQLQLQFGSAELQAIVSH